MRLILQATQSITYLVINNIEFVIINLQNALPTLFQWFYDNQIKIIQANAISFVAQVIKLT